VRRRRATFGPVAPSSDALGHHIKVHSHHFQNINPLQDTFPNTSENLSSQADRARDEVLFVPLPNAAPPDPSAVLLMVHYTFGHVKTSPDVVYNLRSQGKDACIDTQYLNRARDHFKFVLELDEGTTGDHAPRDICSQVDTASRKFTVRKRPRDGVLQESVAYKRNNAAAFRTGMRRVDEASGCQRSSQNRISTRHRLLASEPISHLRCPRRVRSTASSTTTRTRTTRKRGRRSTTRAVPTFPTRRPTRTSPPRSRHPSSRSTGRCEVR
jgi:hypothetical protein